LEDITTKHALIYGLGQCLALIPGVSRSGSTITMGRFLGYSREAAAKFSFYLAIPSVFGAALLELKDVFEDIPAATAVGFPGWPATIIATIISFVVGYIVIKKFMEIIGKISFRPFALYRIGLGVVVLILIATGVFVN
jgi:undecaprenyl-diphosphatase